MNRTSDSSYNGLATEGRGLPWLQDSFTQNVWSRWGVVYRDVRILDGQNRVVAVYNLTEHDLSQAANREALKALFLAAAKVVDTDGDGLPDEWEQVHFGSLSRGFADDGDGDGRDAAAEYAFGSAPQEANLKGPIQLGTTRLAGQEAVTLTFRRPAGEHLEYQVEVSSDLVQWGSSPTAVLAARSLRNLFDGTGTAEANYTFLDSWSARTHRFVRVRAVVRAP
ncbi:MAG: hypothetical protein FJ387_09965 [Verrucomicrobia bacterium]|nr:hypothetical protein [Verrucomicrobiota bacterium]